MDIKADHIIDAKGLSCPMPIVRTKKKISELQPGEVLEVQATDKGSQADIQAWAKSSGEQYLGTAEENGVLKHYIRKSRSEDVKEPISFKSTATNDEIMEKLNDDHVTILDVREPAEYAFQHIPGSVLIPLGEIEDRYDELNKDNEIYVICRTGNRSDFAAQFLTKQGFKKVANVLPGMIGWEGPTDTKFK